MEQSYIVYAKQLDVIVGQIKEATNMSIAKPTNYREALHVAQIYKNNIQDMRNIIDRMEKINPPAIVKNEHNEQIESLKTFLKAMELVSNSVNIQTQTFNKQQYQIGMQLFEIATSKSVSTSKCIGDILTR